MTLSALYKEALDKYLPPEYSQVVYSPAHNDSAQLKKYYLDEEQEKAVRRAFVQPNQFPKILIVTEKLLTGFDAPILYCMYLDKPMRDHVLLQAIARVNRPYEDEEGQLKPKSFGFVLDFVGIFERLEKALAFDSDIVASVIQNIDVLKDRFATLMRETAPEYLPLTKGWDDKSKEAAIEYFKDETKRETFFKFFRGLQNLYDILSPDAFLRPFIEQYLALADLYSLVRNAYTDRIYVDKELTEKTRELLRQHSESGRLELPGAIHTLGPKELETLKSSDASDNTKILNLRKVLAVAVDADASSKPFVLSIGDRAEALVRAYEDRQLTTQQALLAFEKLADEYVQADAQRKQMGVDENTFAIYSALKPLVGTVSADLATAINEGFIRYPDYQWDDQQKSKLRADLYKTLRPLVGPKNMIEAANTLLKLQRV